MIKKFNLYYLIVSKSGVNNQNGCSFITIDFFLILTPTLEFRRLT